jgi:hypothetical protein
MHPLWGHGRRLTLYFLLWVAVGVVLAYMLVGQGLTPFEAWALANPLVLLYAFACLPVWYTCRALPLAREAETALTAQVVAAAAAGGLWALAASALAFIYGWAPLGAPRWVLIWAAGALLYGLVAAGYYVALEGERRGAAERLAHAAELRALKAQLNPHFLYNSLNSISALTAADPARAREMCVLLSDFLRRTLALSQAGPAALVALGEELQLARSYLAIEQVRFGARLQVEEDVAPALLSALVPPLLLQPLMENAVVHGIQQLTAGGRIGIRAGEADGQVRIRIVNPYDAEAPRRLRGGGGLGMQNVHQRLRALFGAGAGLAAAAGGGEFEVTLTLPRKDN